jgi:hypothetical protein
MTIYSDQLGSPSRSVRVVLVAAITIGISSAHVLEDFAYGLPAEAGFDPTIFALFLGAVYLIHAILVALAARDRQFGYLGNAIVGVLWLVAALDEHIPDVFFVPQFRAGLISQALIVAHWLASLLLAIVAFVAWVSRRKAS